MYQKLSQHRNRGENKRKIINKLIDIEREADVEENEDDSVTHQKPAKVEEERKEKTVSEVSGQTALKVPHKSSTVSGKEKVKRDENREVSFCVNVANKIGDIKSAEDKSAKEDKSDRSAVRNGENENTTHAEGALLNDQADSNH